jgi:S-layer homology domain
LPAGALLVTVELEACDTNPSGNVTLVLFRVGKLENPPFVLLTTAETSGTPGCTTVTGNLTSPHQIDNSAGTYFVEVSINGTDDTTRFQAVRALYRLQVSPAPAAASFGDVPTGHPFFPFVEALASSGITAGCGGGNYCVNAPITRGEMAVFLSKALGLHFAP